MGGALRALRIGCSVDAPHQSALEMCCLLAKSADRQPREPLRAVGGSSLPEACPLPAAAARAASDAMAGSGDALRALLRAANALLQQRRYRAALAVLKGFRNGAV